MKPGSARTSRLRRGSGRGSLAGSTANHGSKFSGGDVEEPSETAARSKRRPRETVPSGNLTSESGETTAGAPEAPEAPGQDGASRTAAEARSELAPGLYLVATPIGHARDVTLRALDILSAADVIACEDTRVTSKLLARHGIATSLTAYHDHNAERARPALLARLARGERIALVSDAGTPLISDPGYKLVRAALDAGVPVTTAPGPSSLLAALVLSGLPTDRFLFAGFLPSKAGPRRSALGELASLRATIVFLEAPQRLAESLAAMAETLGARQAAVARELTKRFEEVRRGDLGALARHYAEAGAPLGEVVVVIGPPAEQAASSGDDIDRQLEQALAGMSLRDAAEAVARATGAKRRDVYTRALALRSADKPR
ncbi:MAG: 16S rRNA (cytidine(1402)-2'-O)-methyltransferase [Alphaproteobacteria bacterium]|nr:16S rRNA (cytidine(1402)-2'-O)-methyltransferase [Alphaproteobacteria bacterium]